MENKQNVVSQCAAQREAAAAQVMTIPQAIDAAEWLRRTPDAILDGARAKTIIGTLLAGIESSPCFAKGLKLGLRTFTLLPYDRAGHAAIDTWILEAEAHGCRQVKVADARAILNEWSKRPDLKWPD